MDRTLCPEEAVLRAFLAGTLSEPARQQILQHAAHCPRCHSILAHDAANTERGAEAAARDSTCARDPDTLPSGLQVADLPFPDGFGYDLIRQVGEGGMGVVFQARDRRLGRDVAVKLLNEKHAADPDSRARFLRETRIAGQLQHPGIPPVYEVGQRPDGSPILVMKLVKGSTLSTNRRGDTTSEKGS